MGLGFAVVAAAEAAAAGAGVEEVAAAAVRPRRRDRRRLLRRHPGAPAPRRPHRRRGGAVGAALAVKPLLHVVDGRIAPLEKVRTASKALARLEDLAVAACRRRPGRPRGAPPRRAGQGRGARSAGCVRGCRRSCRRTSRRSERSSAPTSVPGCSGSSSAGGEHAAAGGGRRRLPRRRAVTRHPRRSARRHRPAGDRLRQPRRVERRTGARPAHGRRSSRCSTCSRGCCRRRPSARSTTGPGCSAGFAAVAGARQLAVAARTGRQGRGHGRRCGARRRTRCGRRCSWWSGWRCWRRRAGSRWPRCRRRCRVLVVALRAARGPLVGGGTGARGARPPPGQRRDGPRPAAAQDLSAWGWCGCRCVLRVAVQGWPLRRTSRHAGLLRPAGGRVRVAVARDVPGALTPGDPQRPSSPGAQSSTAGSRAGRRRASAA